MPVVQRSEFTLALNQIASERGVDPSIILDTIKSAILAAFKKDNPIPEEEVEHYSVDLDEFSGETKILKDGTDVTPPGFGRIAAQTAKQVLLQKIREKEKDAIIDEYSKRIGTVVNGMILRFQGPMIVVDIGKAEAVMPPQHKIPNEQYFLNKKIPVYIVEIGEDERRGRDVVVSRSHPGLIEGLLRREVPEVASGSVEIKKVVREPGSRAKIAVSSTQSGIDPVGSCVGQKGVRIQAVIDALDGLEKIDVIQWSGDSVKFITNALSPAKDLQVQINESEKVAKVIAPRDQLPLVIGREGQNVRLASKLSEYNIEVEGSDEPVVEVPPAPAEEAAAEPVVVEEKAEEVTAEASHDEPQAEASAEVTAEEPVLEQTTEEVATETAAPEETVEEAK